ncbi:MAG: PEGA domain-containing protein [bacterium]
MSLKHTLSFVLIFLATVTQAARKPLPVTQLDLSSIPSEAEISIDHIKIGSTPQVLTNIAPGLHLIHISKKGFRPVIETIAIKKDMTQARAFTLDPVAGLALVTSKPAGAEISYNNASLGQTPLLLTTLSPGTHRLTLTLPGFQSKNVDLVIADRTPIKLEVDLMSASGTLNIETVPAEAEVFINGISRGKTPTTIERIPEGSVNIEIKLAGYEPHARQVSLAAGEVQKINLAMKPLPGSIQIVSIPSEARVYINDEFKGMTPYTNKVQWGTYRIRVERPGCEPNARDVVLTNSASITEEFRMTKITGRIEVVTAPAGSAVLLDGKKAGVTYSKKTDTTAFSDPFAIEDILEGEHTIEIIRKGYAPQKRSITITRDQTIAPQFRLIRQFIPNYEVITSRAHYTGVLEYTTEEGIKIETAPGVTQMIPLKDIRKHGPLRDEGQ